MWSDIRTRHRVKSSEVARHYHGLNTGGYDDAFPSKEGFFQKKKESSAPKNLYAVPAVLLIPDGDYDKLIDN